MCYSHSGFDRRMRMRTNFEVYKLREVKKERERGSQIRGEKERKRSKKKE